jgi:hypothetical protein
LIADKLFVAPQIVKGHRQKIYGKLDVGKRRPPGVVFVFFIFPLQSSSFDAQR